MPCKQTLFLHTHHTLVRSQTAWQQNTIFMPSKQINPIYALCFRALRRASRSSRRLRAASSSSASSTSSTSVGGAGTVAAYVLDATGDSSVLVHVMFCGHRPGGVTAVMRHCSTTFHERERTRALQRQQAPVASRRTDGVSLPQLHLHRRDAKRPRRRAHRSGLDGRRH